MSEFFVKPTGVAFVQPKRNPDGSGSIIVLERIVDGVTPDYCIHGKVTCWWCEKWCWLGDNSHQLVSSGDVTPMCKECANEAWATAEAQGAKRPRPITNAMDHRRADGPH